MKQEKIKAAFEQIEEGLAAINTDKDWLQFLGFQSRFYSYSIGNTMLIYKQNPDASFVKGYRAWNDLGRYVKKGSKGIAILAPCVRNTKAENDVADRLNCKNDADEKDKKVVTGFRIAYVYDIADTDGSDEFLPVLVKGVSGNSDRERDIYEKLRDIVSQEHLVLEVSGTVPKGSYNIETGIISINTDYDYLQRIKTLLHEYAHAVDFTMNPGEDIKKNVREMVAESVAFVVMQYMRFDTSAYSIGYIKSWMKDAEELKNVAATVQKIASNIIDKLLEAMDEVESQEELTKEDVYD
ncbi:ArdC-like ssDNA-binding domain-containing protein [Roseburia inulinivorans]